MPLESSRHTASEEVRDPTGSAGHMACYSVREEIQRPAREEAEPETTGARWVAPKTGNGYFLLQPSLPPSEVMVVRGAFGAQTPARPDFSLASFLALLSVAPFAPKVCDLVLFECLYVFLGPKANPHSSKRLSRRCFDPSFPDPPVKSIAADTK